MRAADEIKRLQEKLDSGDIHPDEPLFTLRARDAVAAGIVRQWANKALSAGASTAKVAGAKELANLMDVWPVKQVPGRPESKRGELPPPIQVQP